MIVLRSSVSYEVASAIFTRVDCEFMSPAHPERYTVIAHGKDGVMHFGGSPFGFDDAVRVCMLCIRHAHPEAAREVERIWNGGE
jgi:hypothetical protein